jgi:hypothetical protein
MSGYLTRLAERAVPREAPDTAIVSSAAPREASAPIDDPFERVALADPTEASSLTPTATRSPRTPVPRPLPSPVVDSHAAEAGATAHRITAVAPVRDLEPRMAVDPVSPAASALSPPPHVDDPQPAPTAMTPRIDASSSFDEVLPEDRPGWPPPAADSPHAEPAPVPLSIADAFFAALDSPAPTAPINAAVSVVEASPPPAAGPDVATSLRADRYPAKREPVLGSPPPAADPDVATSLRAHPYPAKPELTSAAPAVVIGSITVEVIPSPDPAAVAPRPVAPVRGASGARRDLRRLPMARFASRQG